MHRLRYRIAFVVLSHCMLNAQSNLHAAPKSPADSGSRPNVLMICVDDLKPTLGCYGDAVAITPNIDRLASRGVVFDKAYCNQAVCSPSRNSLMTGLRPQTIGIYDLPTHFRFAAPDAVTMTEYFIANGYHAAGMGKIYHVGHGNIDDAQSWSVPLWRPKASNYLLKSSLDAYVTDSKGKRRGPPTERAKVSDDEYKDGQIALEAIERLGKLSTNPDQPFFLAVGFQKPHLPFVAPEKYWAAYDEDTLPMPEFQSAPKDAPEYAGKAGGELRNYSGMQDQWPVSETMTRHLIHGYYAATSYVDAQIGRVLDELDRLDLTDETIVLVWGDHGWHLGDHGMWCKHTNYEQAARIPFIIAGPRIDKDAHSAALIETVDIYPTLAELAGLDAPKKLDGKSFQRSACDASQAARSRVTHVYPKASRLGRAIRDARYRMVEWKKIGDPASEAEIELYDYVSDPLETKNIAADQPDVVQAMRDALNEQGEAQPQFKTNKTASTSGNAKPTSKTAKPTSKTAKPKKNIDRAEVFRKPDANQDGFLVLDEFLSRQPDTYFPPLAKR